MFERIYNWAWYTGRNIIEGERYDRNRGEKLLKELVFEIRGEETPGRFLERLSRRLLEYKTNVAIQVDVHMPREIFEGKWQGDEFYYLKSAILTGFLNALAYPGRGGRGGEGGDE